MQVDGGHIVDWQVVRSLSSSLVVVVALLPLVVVAASSTQVGRHRVVIAGSGRCHAPNVFGTVDMEKVSQ